MKERKTVDIASLKERCNRYIATAATAGERQMAADILANTLLEVGAYKGFQYTQEGVQAHILWGTLDETQRQYF
jgi:hypothetical protein